MYFINYERVLILCIEIICIRFCDIHKNALFEKKVHFVVFLMHEIPIFLHNKDSVSRISILWMAKTD